MWCYSGRVFCSWNFKTTYMSNLNRCVLFGRKTILPLLQNYLALAIFHPCKSHEPRGQDFAWKITRLECRSWILAPFYFVCSIIIVIIATLWGGIKLGGPGPWVCWSGGSVLSGTGGPSRLVLMARTNKCMSRTRNHIAPLLSVWAWLHKACRCRSGPWALQTTRTTVNGPTVSVSCPLLVWVVSRVQFCVLEEPSQLETTSDWMPLYAAAGYGLFLCL
jgi:hypothetical protein